MAAVRTPMAAAAACVLLALSACVPAAPGDGAAAAGSSPAQQSTAAPATATRFGDKHRFPSGLVVAVSEPVSFQPSRAAYPSSDNAIAFEISVRNESGQPYRLSNITVTVTSGGVESPQIIDPTQGYTGATSSSKGLPTDSKTWVNLAFAVPAQPAPLEVTLRPHKTRAPQVTYNSDAEPANAR